MHTLRHHSPIGRRPYARSASQCGRLTGQSSTVQSCLPEAMWRVVSDTCRCSAVGKALGERGSVLPRRDMSLVVARGRRRFASVAHGFCMGVMVCSCQKQLVNKTSNQPFLQSVS